MNIQSMMKQAQEMQERLKKQMADMRVEATAGGGMVTVVVSGEKQLQSITLDPEVVSKDDVEMLQDLIRTMAADGQLSEVEKRVFATAAAVMEISSEDVNRLIDQLLRKSEHAQ